MKEKSKLVKSSRNGIIAGLVITILSFFIAIIPCIKTAGIGVCSFGNPFANLTDLSDKYYGFSNNPMTGLVFQFLIPFVIVFLITFNIKKKKERIVDYTKK
jgi:hypothetical protein